MTNENKKPADEMKDVAAGNVPHPHSGSSPRSVPGDPSISTPGATIEVADLDKAAAGVNATPDAGPVDTGDPSYDTQPDRHSSGANPG